MKAETEQPKEFREWLKDNPRRFPRWILRLPHWVLWCEWQLERLLWLLSRFALLGVLEYLGKLSLLVALIVWFIPGCKERRQAMESAKQAAADTRKSRHYVAWQTINSALGKPGSGGRADALQDLNQDRIRMDGISLAGGVVLIGPLNLTNASFTHADFSHGVYEEVSFRDSTFDFSRWDNALAEKCDFRGSSFWSVTLSNSTFVLCDFGFSEREKTKRPSAFILQFGGDSSRFSLCNFAGAESPLGVWNSVSFTWCNFANAKLWNVAIGTNASIDLCNLYGATTASPDFIKWAYSQRLVFTNVASLREWHYCLTNKGLVYKQGGQEFMQWASNQFTTHIVTNNPQAWLDWSRDNLKK